jgi:hypothetical protein
MRIPSCRHPHANSTRVRVSTRSGVGRGITVQYTLVESLGQRRAATHRDQPRMISLWNRLEYPDVGFRLTFYPLFRSPDFLQVSPFLQSLDASEGWGSERGKRPTQGDEIVGKAIHRARGQEGPAASTATWQMAPSTQLPCCSCCRLHCHAVRAVSVRNDNPRFSTAGGLMGLRKVWKRADGDWSVCGLDRMRAWEAEVVVSNPRLHG